MKNNARVHEKIAFHQWTVYRRSVYQIARTGIKAARTIPESPM